MILFYNLTVSATYIEDEIISVIYDEHEPIVITKHDTKKRTAMGQIPTVQAIKQNALICRDARNLTVVIPDDAIERALLQIQKQNNISQEQFIQLLRADGLSLDDYRAELKTLYTVNSMIDFRVNSRAAVSYESILKYYQEHPVYHEIEYCVAIKKFPQVTYNNEKKLITQLQAKDNNYWNNSFWVRSDQLAADKKFISSMKVGSVHVLKEYDVYTVFKLLDKKEPVLVDLAERYEEILSLLKKTLERTLEAEYIKELFNNAIIVDF